MGRTTEGPWMPPEGRLGAAMPSDSDGHLPLPPWSARRKGTAPLRIKEGESTVRLVTDEGVLGGAGAVAEGTKVGAAGASRYGLRGGGRADAAALVALAAPYGLTSATVDPRVGVAKPDPAPPAWAAAAGHRAVAGVSAACVAYGFRAGTAGRGCAA